MTSRRHWALASLTAAVCLVLASCSSGGSGGVTLPSQGARPTSPLASLASSPPGQILPSRAPTSEQAVTEQPVTERPAATKPASTRPAVAAPLPSQQPASTAAAVATTPAPAPTATTDESSDSTQTWLVILLLVVLLAAGIWFIVA